MEFSCFCERSDLKSEEELEKSDSSVKSNSAGLKLIAYYDKTDWGKVADSKKLPVIDPDKISYETFFCDFILKNLPCMFSSQVTSKWLSRKNWVRYEEEEELINFDYLLQVYGEASVSAVNCEDREYKEGYGSSDCRDMPFKNYIAYWKELIQSRGSCSQNQATENDVPCLYLKDWHIVRFHKTANDATPELPYETPVFFQSDFLNEFCTQTDSDDFKFCYMGPKGTYTSFHADVYGSYSWSANVFGVKRWYLYPPGKEFRFADLKTGRTKYDWDDPGVEGTDYIEVIQQAGECIFVPSGWHHVVWNLTDAISINHNWFNGANLSYIWHSLQKALNDVEKELDDLRNIPEFHEQCQFLLKAHHGMNYEDFFKLLKHVKVNRQAGEAAGINIKNSVQLKYDLDTIAHVNEKHCQLDSNAEKYLLKC